MSDPLYINSLEEPETHCKCPSCGSMVTLALHPAPQMSWMLYLSQDLAIRCKRCGGEIILRVRGLRPNPSGEIGMAQTSMINQLGKLERLLTREVARLPPPPPPIPEVMARSNQRKPLPSIGSDKAPIHPNCRCHLSPVTEDPAPTTQETARRARGAVAAIVLLLLAVVSLSVTTLALAILLIAWKA